MKKQTFTFYQASLETKLELPFVNDGIKAGFPSPATDCIQETIDLNRVVVKNPASTFFAHVDGDSMIDECIESGDLLVVDRSLTAVDADLAVCYLNDEFTLKRIRIEKDRIFLVPSNTTYAEIEVTPGDDFRLWGVVIATIKFNRRPKR